MTDITQIEFVAALPGFDVLVFLPDDKTFDAVPIIAWACLAEADGAVQALPMTPRTTFSVTDEETTVPVRLPDGRVIYGDLEFTTDAEWLAHAVTNADKPKPVSPRSGAAVLALDAFRHRFQTGE